MFSWFRRKPLPPPPAAEPVAVVDDVEAATTPPTETSPLSPSAQALLDGCKATEDLFARLKRYDAESADPPAVSPAALPRATRPESAFASGDRSFQERAFRWAEPGTEARRIQDAMVVAQQGGVGEIGIFTGDPGRPVNSPGGDRVPAELFGGYLGLAPGTAGGGHWFLSRGHMHPAEFRLFTATFRDMPHADRQRLYAAGGGALIRTTLLRTASRAFLFSAPHLWLWSRVRRLFPKR